MSALKYFNYHFNEGRRENQRLSGQAGDYIGLKKLGTAKTRQALGQM